MRSRRLIPLLLLISACARPRAVSSLTDEDRASLRALTDAQVKALTAADWQRMVATFSDDVVRMPPDQATVQGRSAIESWLKTFPRVVQYQNAIDAIDGDHDVAYMRGRNVVTLDINGKPTDVRLKWLAIYRRQVDGSWLMVADMWNGNPAIGAG